MRLKTKLFLAGVSAMLILWLGAFALIQRVVTLRINQMAEEAFKGIEQGLAGMQKERQVRMQQAGQLVMNIPELRALIAEQNYELSDENRASLKERIDHLQTVVRASFVCVLDHRRNVIAQSQQAPWTSVDETNRYCAQTAQPATLINSVFSSGSALQPDGNGTGQAEYGLWPCSGHIYQIVAMPLIFQSDDAAPHADADGALILGEQIDDNTAIELARSHNCQITFLSNGRIVASSLPLNQRPALLDLYNSSPGTESKAFVFKQDGATFHGSIQPLDDPLSQALVGKMFVQRDEKDAIVEANLLESLILIMLAGIVAAAFGSFGISAAVTKPVKDLVAGVHKVAQGDLDLCLPVTRRDELGELATAFNDMVGQLRTRSELVRQVAEAQSASHAKSQFLANMSHEIRTPLNGVIGMTELLLGTALSEQQRRYASLAKTSGELLTSLINDILDFSKIEAGKLEIESIDFDLHETIEDVIALLSDRATRKKLELACHFHRDVPRHVRGDPDRLRQIVVNLVNNAIKFTHEGSVVVSATTEATSDGSALVRFSITDTGIGIPPDRIDRLFKPFSQIDASTTRKYGGTGLGLAITRQLAEMMGGNVGVESVPLQGSTFWFTIKFQTRAVTISAAEEPFDPELMRVLAIDDSQTTRTILLEQLKNWGIRANTNSSASAAIEALRRASLDGIPYKIALIDAEMPGMSGFELARSIKADSLIAKTTLIALLPLEVAADTAQLHEAGFAHYMTKPLRQSQLFDGLMRAVAREHAHSARDAHHPRAEAPTPQIRKKQGRLLVAEDNEVNQIVITELLANAGYECKLVDSGRKVIDELFAGQFDLVIMDCQMPEMDGFEATAVIRQREIADRRAAIPIVALTANAMKGDREQCLKAGMDAYCSKPVDVRHLLTTITKLLENRPESTNPAPAVEKSRRASSGSVNDPVILVPTLLDRCMNNPRTVDVVIGKFEKQAHDAVEKLRQGIAVSDLAAIARVAHSLKGAAGILAANRLAELASQMEQLGRSGETAQLEAQFAILKAEINRCIEQLPQVRSIAAESLSSRTPRKEIKP